MVTDPSQNSSKKILIIDDSQQILSVMDMMLSKEGYRTLLATDGQTGLALFEAYTPDLVILDVSMPDMDGWMVCEKIRKTSNVPVIFLTAAHITTADKIRGLDLGANDYITKPFDPPEFMARVRSNLRIAPLLQPQHLYDDGYLFVDFVERIVMADRVPVDLTEKEFALLRILLQFADEVVESETLFERVWGYPESFDANYVRIYMSSLRRKIEPDPKHPTYIQTIRGVGYQFVSRLNRSTSADVSD